MALRLQQLGLIHKGSWQFFKESKFAPVAGSGTLGLQPLPVNDFPFPERYKYLAVPPMSVQISATATSPTTCGAIS